jgi:hypothetical protein
VAGSFFGLLTCGDTAAEDHAAPALWRMTTPGLQIEEAFPRYVLKRRENRRERAA